jgi:hypothetical protein
MGKKVSNLPESLAKKGFQAMVVSTQHFNVICVSKYGWDDKVQIFHAPADGGSHFHSRKEEPRVEAVPIEVRQVLYTRNDITLSQTVVTYQGKDYALEGIRNGLSGSSLVIGIYNEDEEPYWVWHLYTDTPSAKDDRPGQAVTQEDLHLRAKEAMGWGPQY